MGSCTLRRCIVQTIVNPRKDPHRRFMCREAVLVLQHSYYTSKRNLVPRTHDQLARGMKREEEEEMYDRPGDGRKGRKRIETDSRWLDPCRRSDQVSLLSRRRHPYVFRDCLFSGGRRGSVSPAVKTRICRFVTVGLFKTHRRVSQRGNRFPGVWRAFVSVSPDPISLLLLVIIDHKLLQRARKIG